MVVSGPTMCSKSTFVHALLKDKLMFSTPPDRVYWFYGQGTDALKDKDYIQKEGLPESFADIPPNSVIVLDDLMHEAKDHAAVTKPLYKVGTSQQSLCYQHYPKFFLTN